MKKVWEKIARSFKEAEKFDRDYYRSMSRAERLADMQFLREICSKMKKGARYECGKRLQRVVRIIQQT